MEEAEKRILKISQDYARKAGFRMNKDKKQIGFILKGLKANDDKFGFRYCPCRIVTGNFDKDRLIICPCIYHKSEIKTGGHCLCRFFYDRQYEKKFGKRKV